uniref:Uncharacterized protein n=1 Tax=Rhipicephalus zambeziensis TaxID=60191 RepID=A0A224YL50_9ACAR
MSAVATKRERRKKLKATLSFGSSSGASANLPSNMQANLPELFAILKMKQQALGDEADGSMTGWSAHKQSLKDELLMFPATTHSAPYSAQSSPDSTAVSDGKEYELNILGDGENGTTSICVEETVDQMPEPQLTEDDTTDIVSQLQAVLLEYGPSQEEDLLKALKPEQARRVLAAYNTLTDFLDGHPGFKRKDEDLLSFIYYVDPDEDDEGDDDDCYYTSPTADLCNGLSALAVSAKDAGYQFHSPVDSDSGSQSVCTSSSCSTSYQSAMEEEEEDDDGKGRKPGCKDCCTQTPSQPRCQSRGVQAVQQTLDAESQTEEWDPDQVTQLEQLLRKRDTEISELQERLASIQEEHAHEVQELYLKYEMLQNESLVPTIQDEANQELGSSSSSYISEEEVEVDEEEEEEEKENEEPEEVATKIGEAEDEEGEQGEQGWPEEQPPAVLRQRSPPARAEPEEQLHALSIEPRPKQAPSVEQKVKRPERPQVPEFYDLHWRMEQAAASCSDVESMWSSRGGSPTKSKTEQQIAKIVQMLKKKQPDYSEQQIRRHVDHVRDLQGGFSRMTFNHIVALVLAHMKNDAQ